MYKKIYSLLAGLILLSACTAEDAWNNTEIVVPGNESETYVTFSVDKPILQTKSSSANDAEAEGITNLRLFTFGADGLLIEEVTPTPVGDRYKAIIDKSTTDIHFLANVGTGDLGLVKKVSSITDLINLETEKQYLFWGSVDLLSDISYDAEAGSSELGTINMYRNWAKFSLQVAENIGLYDVTYMLYNQATKSRAGFVTDKLINTPIAANATYIHPATESEAVFGTADLHPFENSKNNTANPTFIIIKARYESSSADFGYYKLDLSSKDEVSGATVTHDVIRNYWYKVTINGVAMKGVSWDEVTHPNKLPDNNITAALELDDYPKISYLNETLEVEKTTFIFTEHSNPYEFGMWATYKVGDNPGSITVIPDDIENVFDGDINDDGTRNIWAALLPINESDPGFYKEGYFYVKGGTLQRKIKVILRKAYSFEFWAKDNPVEGILGTDVDLKFRMLEEPDPSIFPLECKIRSTKLYAVEEGVRVQPNNNGTYDYIYTAQEYQEEYSLAFKTNSSNSDETLSLSAQYFNTAYENLTTSESSFMIVKPAGRYRYTTATTGNGTVMNGGIVYVNYTSSNHGDGSSSFVITSGDSDYRGYVSGSITLPKDAQNITLHYENGGVNYAISLTLNQLQSSDAKVLRKAINYVDVAVGGTFQSGTWSLFGGWTYTNITGEVSYSYTSAGTGSSGSGTFTVSGGNVSNVTLTNIPEDAVFNLTYSSYSLNNRSISNMQSGQKRLT